MDLDSLVCSWSGLQGPGQEENGDVQDAATKDTLAGSDPPYKLKEENNSGPGP